MTVNNAGYTWGNVIQKMTDQQWQDILDVRLGAPFRILRAASGYLRSAAKQEASEDREIFRKVVNVSSSSGVPGNAGQANCAAAKMGVMGFTKAMAKERGRYRINVNAVAFGLVNTRLTEATDDPDSSIDIEGRTIRGGVRPAVLHTLIANEPSMTDQIPFVNYLVLDEQPHLRAHECTTCGARYFDRRSACASRSEADFRVVHVVTGEPCGRSPSSSTPLRASPPLRGWGRRLRRHERPRERDQYALRPRPHLAGMKLRLATYSLGEKNGIEAIAYGFEPA